MIEARQHRIIAPFFRYYAIWKIRRNFKQANIIGEFVDSNSPLLIIANHFSWWDGFWINYLNAKVFKRNFYFMMLKEQLEKYSFFKNAGGFSVSKGKSDVLQTIRYTCRLLNDNKNMVMIFPQGKIESLYTDNFKFEKGIELIIRLNNSNLRIIFVANLVEYYSEPKPTVNMYFEDYSSADFSIDTIETAYNDFIRRCKQSNFQGKP